MIKTTTKNKADFVLKAVFESNTLNKDVIKKTNSFTEFVSKKEVVIYLGKKESFKKETLKKVAQLVAKYPRNLQVNIKSFTTKSVKEVDIVRAFVEEYIYINGKITTYKTAKATKPSNINLLGLSAAGKKEFKETKEETEVRNWVRSFQLMPQNKLNSVSFANEIKKTFASIKNVSVKVLTKKEIQNLKMGLLLGVNRGSEFDPRVVILEYKGDPSSKEKTTIVGKGIMFDAGGYSLKQGAFIRGMKFDMSGAAISAGAMRLVASRKPKRNFSVVLPLTDNMIGKLAQLPDSVQTSMNGKTVEINNTDAEGRLVMADGLTYAIRKLKSTKVMTIATLTGAMKPTLGKTYTGTWATQEKDWEEFLRISKITNEPLWRLPLHDDYLAYFKTSPVADLFNTDYTGNAGSSTAAMFLKEFTEDLPFVHFDIAITAEADGKATGVLVKTLAKYING